MCWWVLFPTTFLLESDWSLLPLAGGGHIIRTLVFGLIANAFDVGSDLLNAFQYYRYYLRMDRICELLFRAELIFS